MTGEKSPDALEVGLRPVDLGKFDAVPGPYEIPAAMTTAAPVPERAVG
jgi:hypothetical protein